MINRDLFYFLFKVKPQTDRFMFRVLRDPMFKGIVPDITPETVAWRIIEKGCVMEYYDWPGQSRRVTWFWGEGDYIIPTSYGSSMMTLKAETAVSIIEYGPLIRMLKEHEDVRREYKEQREAHAKRIAERISDLKNLTPHENYMKLLKEKPWVFEFADKEDIASYLNVSVSTLESFMSINAQQA